MPGVYQTVQHKIVTVGAYKESRFKEPRYLDVKWVHADANPHLHIGFEVVFFDSDVWSPYDPEAPITGCEFVGPDERRLVVEYYPDTVPVTLEAAVRAVYSTGQRSAWSSTGVTNGGTVAVAEHVLARADAQNIVALGIKNSMIDDLAVTTVKLANSAVDDTKLATNSVTNAKILADAVTTAKIAAQNVTVRSLHPHLNTAALPLNGSFDVGNRGDLPDGWEAEGSTHGVDWETDDTYSYDGHLSCRINNTSINEAHGPRTKFIPINPSTDYEFLFAIRSQTSTAGRQVRWYAEWYDKSQSSISNTASSVTELNSFTLNTFVLNSWVATSPSNAAFVKFRIGKWDNGTSSDHVFHFDALKITPISPLRRDLLVSGAGSDITTPRKMGFWGFASGNAVRWTNGDDGSGIQSGFGFRQQIYSYHNLELYGGLGGAVPSFTAGAADGNHIISKNNHMFAAEVRGNKMSRSVANGTTSASALTINTTGVWTTLGSVTFTQDVLSQRLVIIAHGSSYVSAGGTIQGVRIVYDGTASTNYSFYFNTAAEHTNWTFTWVLNSPSASIGNKTLSLQIARNGGAGTINQDNNDHWAICCM
jgi:hypothetical protein